MAREEVAPGEGAFLQCCKKNIFTVVMNMLTIVNIEKEKCRN
jgi:hypothetical protein